MQQRTLSVLVHGPSKTGKSTFAATAPKPLLYIDVEGGTRFLRLRKVYWEPAKYAPPACDGTWDVCVVMIDDIAHYEDVQAALNYLVSGQHCFEAVVIDSVSRLQNMLVEKITNRQQAQMQDWGEVFRSFMGTIRDFHGLTTNRNRPVSVCLVSESKEDQSGYYHPFVQGQSKTTLPYVVDVLAAMEIVQWFDDATQSTLTAHRITTGYHPKYETGERVGGTIPAHLDNEWVNFDLMLDYVYGPRQFATVTPAPADPNPEPIVMAAPAEQPPAPAEQPPAPVETPAEQPAQTDPLASPFPQA